MALNLLNIESVSVAFGRAPVLSAVSLGINDGDRIGIVGRNGGGKSTLLRVLAGQQQPDSGRRSATNAVRIGVLAQAEDFGSARTVRDAVVGNRPEHEWAADAQVREILEHLLGNSAQLDRELRSLSGGERRRTALAALLISSPDLLLLDEPTNHLDVEAISWLAAHLRNRPRLSFAVITHDRWFLDAVCEQTWEVVSGAVESYEGGYSAYVLAKAERMRQLDAESARRNNLLRKELAWLRRGAPARTSKPKFRIAAANELIASEPPPRDAGALLAFAGARLGKTVWELHDASLAVADKALFDNVTWLIGPGDRIGILGANGAGKTSLLRVLCGESPLTTGRLKTGQTVRIAHLSQQLAELNPTWRTLEAVQEVAQFVTLADGRELSAGQLLERLGFPADAQWTPVGDLSGGERRRLQLTRLLMGSPNVLVLDEPTNDFDVETLASLEDLLDSFGGTLIVVSHDRYFLERVCDRFVALLGDGKVRDLPAGIDEYLRLRAAANPEPSSVKVATPAAPLSGARKHELQKSIGRLDRRLAKVALEIDQLQTEIALVASDYAAVTPLAQALRDKQEQQARLEEDWLAASSELEG